MESRYEQSSSPVATGLSLYTEDTTVEVSELLNQMSPSEDITLSEFSSEYIASVIGICESLLVKEVINHSELIPLHHAMKRLAKKLEFTEGSATAQTIRHTYGLFCLARLHQDQGARILIIESCTGTGEQVITDLDLCYQKNGNTYHCDYTQGRSDESLTESVWSKNNKPKKYKALLRSAGPGVITRVSSYNMELKYFNLHDVEIRVHDYSPREADFSFVDKVTEGVHALTWQQAETVLANYATMYQGFSKDRSSMIQTPGCYTSKASYVKVMGAVHKNGPQQAKLYEDFRDEMTASLTASRNQRNLAESYFSLDNYDKVANPEKGTRWVQPLPSIRRGYTESNPFERLASIVADMDKLGKPVDSLTRMISMLKDRDQVVWTDLPTLPSGPYDTLYSNITLQRAANKEGVMDAYIMRVARHSFTKTINDTIIEPMRSRNKSDRIQGNSYTLSVLEDKYEKYVNVMNSQGSGSYLIDDAAAMIDDVLEDGHCASMTRTIMLKALGTMRRSKLLSQLAMTQEITQSLLTGARKRRRFGKNVGGINESTCVFGLTCISDRAGVVSHNLGPLTFGEFKDVTYFLHGDLDNINAPLFVKQHKASITSPLSMSPAQMDWNITILHKALSWMSLRYETCMTHFPDKEASIPKEMVMPLSMAFLNSNTFSQAADQLRYFFVNGMGYTSGVGPLFKKLSWYQPKTCLEQLYVLRMYKMSDILSVAKCLNTTDALVVGSNVKIHEMHDLKMTVKVTGYLVAMPDEFETYLSQQHTFNSFYNSRALTIQRYQKLVSEALVMKKQMEAREDYLSVKSMDLEHEARNLGITDNLGPEEIMDLLNNHNYVMSAAQVFSPCPRVAIMGFLASTRQFAKLSDKTVGKTIRRVYSCDLVHRNLKVSSIMNNRGSVRSSKTNGLVVTKVVTDGKKTTKTTQNSKCYRTVIDLLNRYMKGETPAVCPKNFDYVPDEKAFDDDLSMLESLVDLPDALGPVLAWLTNNFASCISKMVHKDQLGAREIAVLNAASRLMCKYVEDVARHIRDVNLSKGDRTNLIEISDKRDKVLFEKRRTDAMKRRQNVFYDSADCSTWGPSMMCHDFYLVLKLRFPCSTKTTMLRNSLSLFGSKVFKIPDAIYLDTVARPPHPAANVVNDVKRMMLSMSKEMGDFSKQILYLEESMHQGILGCTSSVKGADAHTLSNYVLNTLYKEHGFSSVTFSTSDDYARIIRWNKGSVGTFKMLKDSLDVHVHIMRTAGIKRNLQKSTLSKNYFEFNSEFFTSIGEIKPDIKSRLAYVDISTDPDPYPTALRCMSQGVEFLRSEGSIMGACWVFLLNNLLAMYSNQSRKLWKDLGRGIYEVPLELGGLVRPDVIKCCISHPLVGVASNYGGDENLERAFSLMADMSPFTSTLSEIEGSTEVKLNLPSLSRSGTVHLCKRLRRTTRDLEEFLTTADVNIFRGLHRSRYTSNLVMSLMASAQRERALGDDQGSARRFMVTQTPASAKLYRVNSLLLSALSSASLCTRDELHAIAKTFRIGDKSAHPIPDWALDFQQMYSDLRVFKDTMRNLKPASMSPIPRIGHTHVRRQTFSNQTYVYDAMQEFEAKNLPIALGGTVNLHPWKYLEGKMSYGNFLSKMTVRKQGFRLVLREKDQATRNFVELLLVSNYMAGCRLHYNFSPNERPQIPADNILNTLLPVLESKISPARSGIKANLLSPGLRQAAESGQVSKIDITDFVNILTRESDYFIRSQELQQTVLGMLASSGFSERFVITPSRLALGIPECKFKSSDNVVAWQRNENAEHGLSGREIIMYSAGKYTHYLWGTTHDLLCPVDSDLDTYYLANVGQMDELRVKLRPISGFLMLTDYHTSDPLQVLSQTVVDSKPINLYMERPIVFDDWLMERLKVKRMSQFEVTNMVDYYQASTGLVMDEEEEVVLDEDEALIMMPTLDSDSDDGIEFNILDGYDLSFLDNLQPQPVPHAQSDSSSSSGEPSAPVSSQSSIRQPEGVLVSILSTAITSIPAPQMARASRHYHKQFNEGLMVTLPINIGIQRLADDNGISAIRQLYDTISTMDDLDRAWLEDTLDHCLLQLPVVRQHLDITDTSVDSLFEEEDDFF